MTCSDETCGGGVYDLCLTRRQIYTQTFTVSTTEDGVTTPMNLTGALIEFFAQPVAGGDLVTETTTGGGIVIAIPETDGTFTLTIGDGTTFGMDAGEYAYEIWINGQQILKGALSVIDTIGTSPNP